MIREMYNILVVVNLFAYSLYVSGKCFRKYEKYGTCFCACDSSFENLTLSRFSSAEALMLCSMRCSRTSSCVAYNFFNAPNQCQLFNRTIDKFSVVPSCQYFCDTNNFGVDFVLSRNLSITVDNVLVEFYVNGVPVNVATYFPNANDWTVFDTYTLTTGATLLAVKSHNSGGFSGLMAKTADNYILTNSSWKCTNNSYDGWYEVDYDDSFWPDAVVGRRKKFYNDAYSWFNPAQWITDLTDCANCYADFYCRKHF
ncbi:hypothetical protein HELRODRAFT_160760 [Helobdella robusta]|uniref:Apple domain-containing protein n=1 Tax=Helobdella robusta TaxID=6412 RepID=T1EQP5_HELRO|nr:hypothetical protein HELRODRAFT_160760 [Helobdella robusta]ESO06577.1 hypothetical protein HELRODRAFT_160760 [Helobdella robusta]